MGIDISGKDILLLGIGFYDYEKAIIDELSKRGANVFFIDTVYKSFLKKILLRLAHKWLRKIESDYLLKEILKQPSTIDYIIIIKGDALREKHIALLKKKYPYAKMLLYLWDSLIRIGNSELLLKNFDKILTFDRVDAINYGLIFRPLFYRKCIGSLNADKFSGFKYDISFVGYMHSDRYKILHQLKNEFEKQHVRYKFVLYANRSSYFIYRYVKKVISKDDSDFFVFKPISYKKYSEISLSSKVILDLPHPLQNGLTMRSIEAIGFRRKILTTNSDIQNYSIIDKRNYAVFDSKNVKIDYNKFMGDYVYKEEDNHFSLGSFVDDLFSVLILGN